LRSRESPHFLFCSRPVTSHVRTIATPQPFHARAREAAKLFTFFSTVWKFLPAKQRNSALRAAKTE
jgi:hypothetical protein